MKSRLWKRVVAVGLVLALMTLVFQLALAEDAHFGAIAVSPLEPGMTDDGVEYDIYDIVVRESYEFTTTAGVNDVTYQWYKLFDGEEFGIGPKHNLMAMAIEGYYGVSCRLECIDGIYMTFSQDAIRVPGITPQVAGQDIVLFTPVVSVTEVVDGNFELVFDGSDVGLTTTAEKIEAMDYWSYDVVSAADVELPNDCFEGIFFINTVGAYRVPAAGGGSLVGSGSDVLMFCATNVGPNTAGFWFRGFDEGDNPINPPNAINGIDVESAYYGPLDQVEEEAAALNFHFSTRTTFTANSVAGGPGEVFWFDGSFFGPAADLNDTEPSLNGVAGALDMYFYSLP